MNERITQARIKLQLCSAGKTCNGGFDKEPREGLPQEITQLESKHWIGIQAKWGG